MPYGLAQVSMDAVSWPIDPVSIIEAIMFPAGYLILLGGMLVWVGFYLVRRFVARVRRNV